MGIFSKNEVPTSKPKRNNIDLRRQNNLTGKFGQLLPFCCIECLPGDSFKIDTAAGIRMLPFMFPIQTKMKCYFEYFYVRSRNLWKGWQDWICSPNSDDHEIPFLSYSNTQKQFTTGSLGDYLGLPTTVLGTIGSANPIGANPTAPTTSQNFTKPFNALSTVVLGTPPDLNNVVHLTNKNAPTAYFLQWSATAANFASTTYNISPNGIFTIFVSIPEADQNQLIANLQLYYEDAYHGGEFDCSIVKSPTDEYPNRYALNFTNVSAKNIIIDKDHLPNLYLVTKDYEYINDAATGTNLESPNNYVVLSTRVKNTSVVDATKVFSPSTIYNNLRINALPFRAYEQIYNSFYRDQRNNPITDASGKLTPNVYSPTGSGVDDYDYRIYNRNWEQDYLTTAVTSPQQGIAPLVGITTTGVASFVSEDGSTYEVPMEVGSDGDTIIKPKFKESVPEDVRKAAINVATQGISINDFRGVNALQHWLEKNIRRGIKYRDQIEGHFGVTPGYNELDMPEFLGGFSDYININQINQTSESTPQQPLGSYAGQGALATSGKTIRHYCDEHGYIIGIMSIVPIPCYSQMLPKHFLKNSPLDYYFPEFNHLGMQPISYKEVTPLQILYNKHINGNMADLPSLDDTFGYQLPWYDYLQATDEVHGQFRTYYKNFVLQRLYNNVPTINPNFLAVNSSDVNNVFSVDSENDKFLGQIHLDIVAKRPISRVLNPQII